MYESQLKQAIKTLRAHNAWRRGGDGPQTDPQTLGEAIVREKK